MTLNHSENDLHESGSILKIDTQSLYHNLNYFKSKLQSKTLIMAMVKAVAYGHGAVKMAVELEQTNAVNYFGVANIQKGIELRKAGIKLPIMITNPISTYFKEMCEYCLEPVIHNFDLAQAFSDFLLENNLRDNHYPIHVKFNTGMNRFGIDEDELDKFIRMIDSSHWQVKSVMSHLACSDNPEEDDFTLSQFDSFNRIKNKLRSTLGEDIIYHILNSNGALRFPEYQFDMVRIGIGLYGASEFIPARKHLKPIATFQAQIAQIRLVKAGDSISYSRSGRTDIDKYIGTLALGYADGFPRSLGNGNWQVEFNDKLYPTIGNVCMDYIMIDLGTDQPEIELESYITIFGGQKSIFDYAEAQDTICYEAMTDLGNRVQRILID